VDGLKEEKVKVEEEVFKLFANHEGGENAFYDTEYRLSS